MAKKGLLKEYDEETHEVCRSDFPPNFVFGVGTSAYQVEGACNDGGRGPSIWDAFSHSKGNIIDGSNGDVAVDQYHRYKEDVELIAKLGFEAHRFSISWSRIFPDGLGTKINEEGITYYNNFINALLEKGIQPYVTLYHWDLPLYLHENMGGWLNKQIVEYFSVYADTCFASFGDRVKDWITFNEPYQTAINGYGVGRFAPGRHECSSTEPFWVAHHQLLAHAAAVSIYRSKYKDKQGGQVGLVVDCEWAEANSDTIEDKVAAARRLDFQLGCLLKYFAWQAASEWLYVVPWGMHKVLNYIAQRYNNPPIYVTENGMDDEDNDTSPLHEMLDDKLRVSYFKRYLSAVAKAIRDGADVRGYFAWSLLDNFEWAQGYTKRFGLVYVDYKNGLSRHPKSSAYWFLRFFKGVEGKYGKEE
ncbi:hypothetical protein C1H46_015027 [Malus baccata]|uniref:Beta-glucosidase n=1 Tax=Malus baccata TaxID=106549 RepID=A0A540MLV7_MALBA|nr:hypothetical protein C1H46_015027 [Malus baccata]